MADNRLINEVFWLRSIACLAVTFGHALQTGYEQYTDPSSFHTLSYLLYMFILFGVPVFVFISEFLLSNKYSTGVPKGFLIKRLKILLVPYVFMNIVYAFFDVDNWSFQAVFYEAFRNIFLGHSTVYFVLIIFQFYLMHIYLGKYLNLISPKIAIPVAFIVNVLYLSIFNFTEPPNNPYGGYFWNPGYWMPFVGWIFYFVLGFYFGKNYHSVLSIFRKYKILVIVMPVISLGIMLLMNKYYFIAQNSKRVDMLLFASSMIFFIMYTSSYLKRAPKLILLISNYSFSIFLLNELFFLVFRFLSPPSFLNIITYSVVVFFLSLGCSILVSYLMNKLSFGKYLVGNIMTFKISKDPTINRIA